MRENIKELEDLIQNGYELELISFEMDIPLEELQSIRENINRRKQVAILAKKDAIDTSIINMHTPSVTKPKTTATNKKQNKPSSRTKETGTERLIGFQKIRAKYYELYGASTMPERIEFVENEELNKIIDVLEAKVQVLEGCSKKERRPGVKIIRDTIDKISDQEFSTSQLKRLVDILYRPCLMNNKLFKRDTIDYAMYSQRRTILPKFINKIIAEVPYVNTKEELKNLEGMVTQAMKDENRVLVGSLELKLASKNREIDNKNFAKINSLTPELQEVVKKLVDGNLDFQEGQKAVVDEANKRFELTKGNRFSLTAEQQEKQVYLNIGDYIANNGTSLSIKSPKDFMKKFMEFTGCDLSRAIFVTSGNLISATRYDEAMSLCNDFLAKTGQDSPLRPLLRSKIGKIKNIMLGKRILDVIHANDSQKDRQMYRELTELIRSEKIDTSYVPIGKNCDGSKNILLREVITNRIR